MTACDVARHSKITFAPTDPFASTESFRPLQNLSLLKVPSACAECLNGHSASHFLDFWISTTQFCRQNIRSGAPENYRLLVHLDCSFDFSRHSWFDIDVRLFRNGSFTAHEVGSAYYCCS